MLNNFFEKYKVYLYLSFFLALGAVLRLHHIGLRPLWLDEANSVNLINYKFGELYDLIISTGNSLAYVYLIKFWSLLFGDSETAIRSLSTLAGLASIIAIYHLGKLLFNQKAGLWAAWIMSVNYFSVFYSIQARPYSLLILLSVLSYYFFIKILADKNKIRLALYVSLTAAGLYFHPWFYLIFGSQLLYIIFVKNIENKLILYICQSAIFIFSIPWFLILYKLGREDYSSFIVSGGLAAPVETIKFFIGGGAPVYIIFSIFILLYLLFETKEENGQIKITVRENFTQSFNKNNYLVLNYLMVPLLAAIVLDQFVPFYKVGRYEAVVLPAFILLVASLWQSYKNKVISLVVAVALLATSYQAVARENVDLSDRSKNDRTAARQILEQLNDDDAVIFTGISRPSFDYYLRHFNYGRRRFSGISYPAEMESHPAYNNQKKLLRDKNFLGREANALVERLKQSKAQQAFLINDGGEVGGMIMDKLDKNFQKIKIIGMAEKIGDGYGGDFYTLNFHFSSIIVYKVK